MSRMNSAVIGAVMAVLLGASLAACSSGSSSSSQPSPDSTIESMPQHCSETGPVVFVVSGRQDSPAPALTGEMSSAAWTAILNGSSIGLVDLDGKPRLIKAGAFSDPGANPAALQVAEQNYLNALGSAVEDTRAAYPHADVLDALNVAGRAARAACPYGGTVYVEDSGLQETGPMNFRTAGLLGAAPSDVASFLARNHDLPDLHGLKVVFSGLGDVAPPQAPLGISQQDNVIAIWSAIAKAGGATSVVIDPAPRNGISAPQDVPAVLLVPVPSEPAWSSGDQTFVFPDSGAVGFEPNTTVFRDPSAATAALQPLARYLVANPSARIELTGTTAHWGTLAGCILLAEQRADTVKAVLVQMGASPGQISTRGLGWLFPGYENDQGPNGSLLPGPAEHNRSVIVTQLPDA